MNTRQIKQQTRYIIEHRFYTRCADKMCHTKHFTPYDHDTPTRPILDYIICDKASGEVIWESKFIGDTERHLQSILDALTDAEWQQIVKSA